MNLNHIKVLLRSSIIAGSRMVLIMNGGTLKESKKITHVFARIYCDYARTKIEEIPSSNSESNSEVTGISEHKTLNYTNIDYDTITGKNPKKMKKLKLIQEEIDLLIQKRKKVPRTLTVKNWQALLTKDPKIRRFNYIGRLYRLEKRKLKEEMWKQEELERKKLTAETQIESTEKYPKCNMKRLFYTLPVPYLNRPVNWKLLQASVFGPHILVDCSYEKVMCDWEITLCAKQLNFIWSHNRKRLKPFNIIYCNFKRDGQLAKDITLFKQDAFDPCVPFIHTEKNFIELFPKENLVYLTPHCNEYIEKYEPDSVYIIGGVVDAARGSSSSFNRAVKDGIRMAKLPLDKYFGWEEQTTVVTMSRCFRVLADLKDGDDMKSTLRNLF